MDLNDDRPERYGRLPWGTPLPVRPAIPRRQGVTSTTKMAHIIVIGSYRRTMSLPIPSVLFLECTLALVSLNVHGTSYLWSRNERSPSPLLRKQETPPPLARVQSCCVAGCARIGTDYLGAACPMNTAESLRAFRYPVQRPGREGEAIWDASGSSLPPGKGNRGGSIARSHHTNGASSRT